MKCNVIKCTCYDTSKDNSCDIGIRPLDCPDYKYHNSPFSTMGFAVLLGMAAIAITVLYHFWEAIN